MGSRTATEEKRSVRIDDLVVDYEVQPRNGPPDPEVVGCYAADMDAGDLFPPPVAFDVDGRMVLVDGRHRVDSARANGAKEIACVVRTGTLEEAKEYAASCNTKHGKQRSREDLEKAIENLFSIPKYAEISDREIAVLARCRHQVVGAVRRRLVENGVLQGRETTVGRDGRARRQPKPRVKVDGHDVSVSPREVEQLVSGMDLPEGAVVEVVTHAGASDPGPVAARESEPFDPEGTDLGQLLPSQKGKDGKFEDGPSMRMYRADSKAYMDPVIWEFMQVADRVREAAERAFTRARKANHNNLPPFLYRLQQLLRVRDVLAWEVCKKCEGAGQLPGSSACPSCKGAGYRV